MYRLIREAGIVMLCLVASASAMAAATVSFVHPDKMTDVPHFDADLQSMETVFRQHLEELAARLPAGQDLKVEFLDIDLAGDVFPRVAVRDIRVMKGQADWPRMHLRYSVEQDGKVLRSGDMEISDPNYLMGSNFYSNELYGHEKQLLDDWFGKEVLTKR